MPKYACDGLNGAWRAMDGAGTVTAPSRDSLVYGDYLPGPDTTGLVDESLLSVVSAATTYTSAHDGQVIENKYFQNYVTINGVVNITFRNCKVKLAGSVTRTDRPVVLARNARNANNLWVDCLFQNDIADPFIQNGWMGRGTTLRRCDISGGVDGIGVAPAGSTDRADVRLEGTWIHDLLYIRPYSGHSDNQTHSDGIQWHGGPGLTIIGSRIEGFMDTLISNWTESGFYPGKQTISGIMVNSSGSFLPTGELHITKSWINGGGVGINMVGVPTCFLTDDGSEIVGNHFGYDFGFGTNSGIYCKSSHVFDLEGNSRWVAANPLDSSIPFNVRTHG